MVMSQDPLCKDLSLFSRKKADTLLLRQDDLKSLLNEKTSQIIDALLETRTIVKEDLLSRRNGPSNTSMDHPSDLQPSTLLALWDAQTVEVEIVQSLHFSLIDDRHHSIPEAHRKTFRWIFDASQEEDYPWSNFVQ